MKDMPADLQAFVQGIRWTFAKTYAATWPHEYVVRDRVDEGLFVRKTLIPSVEMYRTGTYRRAFPRFGQMFPHGKMSVDCSLGS